MTILVNNTQLAVWIAPDGPRVHLKQPKRGLFSQLNKLTANYPADTRLAPGDEPQFPLAKLTTDELVAVFGARIAFQIRPKVSGRSANVAAAKSAIR